MQPTPERPEQTVNVPYLGLVILVDDAFVLGIDVGQGRWSLPVMPIPQDHGIDVVLKKFLTQFFALEIQDVIDAGGKIDFGMIYTERNEKENLRKFTHTFILRVPRALLEKSPAPDGFGMLPLEQIQEAPEGIMVSNHHRIILDSIEVGK